MSVKSIPGLIIAIMIISLAYSCKSSFEKIRTSNDPEYILTEANKLFDEGKNMNAQILYEIIIPFYRGKNEAEEIFYRYAYTYYNLRDYSTAAHYFRSFSSSFLNSDKREEALYMAAYSSYLMSPSTKLDQQQSVKAIEDFQNFVNIYPNSEKVDQCNQLIDELRVKLEEKAYSQGILYYNMRRYVSSVVAFENMLQDFPETRKEEEVRFMILKASYDYARNSIFEKRVERYEDTIEKYNSFIRRYPDSTYRKETDRIQQNANNEIKKIKDGYKS
jgi:outer membrane protein assembly factor BamD